MTVQLILGGARSGKSRFAEQTALSSGKLPIYIATAQALDSEMLSRISHHQSARDNRWQTIEEPIALGQCLLEKTHERHCVVVDCLTLWLTNLLLAGDDVFIRERNTLLTAIPDLRGDILFVSNEVGWGIVPADPLSRRFIDEAGRLHQQLASLCDRVTLMAAGLPLTLKG